MTMVFLQYPAVTALLALTVLFSALTARFPRGRARWALPGMVCAAALVLTALALAVPYQEVLVLLLLPALTCALVPPRKGGEK